MEFSKRVNRYDNNTYFYINRFTYFRGNIIMSDLMILCGLVSLVLAPFTGITVVTAMAFFVIAYVFRS